MVGQSRGPHEPAKPGEAVSLAGIDVEVEASSSDLGQDRAIPSVNGHKRRDTTSAAPTEPTASALATAPLRSANGRSLADPAPAAEPADTSPTTGPLASTDDAILAAGSASAFAPSTAADSVADP